MALQSSASVSDPICLSEIKTEFDLISSDCLTGFYQPHSESTVPASGTICLTDFLGESQILTFSPSSFVTWNTTYASGGIVANYMIFGNSTGHFYSFLYTHHTASTHTLSVKHNHGGTGTARTNQPYSTTTPWGSVSWSGSNDGYFTDSDRWSSYSTDYDYITKVVYTFSSVYDGDDFTVTSEKPAAGWGDGTDASVGYWTWDSAGGLDSGGMSTHTFAPTSASNQHLGGGAGSNNCGSTSDRVSMTAVFTYIPH